MRFHPSYHLAGASPLPLDVGYLLKVAPALRSRCSRAYHLTWVSLTLGMGYVFFIIGDWNAKVGSQETPGVTGKFDLGIRNEAGQRSIEFCQENTLVIANTHFQQHRRRLYTWTSPDGQHQNQIDYILCSQRWRSCIQSTKTRPGANCG